MANISYELRITSPNGANTVLAYPTFIDINSTIQEVSVLTATFEYGWTWYHDEDNPANSIQLNSYVELLRDSVYIFRGFIYARRLLEGGGSGEQVFSITCYDPMGKLEKNLASIDGDPLFTRQTQHVDISQITLKQAPAIGDAVYPFFPLPGDTDPWIPSSYCNQTTLDANIDNAVTTIVATTSNEGILPLGLIRIETEWIQYDGYDYTAANAKYRFKNCVRGVLGTAAAAHLAGKIIYQRVSQKIHPIQPIHIEGWNVAEGAWESLSSESYAVQSEEGRFDFTYDILDFPAVTKYNNIRATYAVFDEDITITGTHTGAQSTTVLIDAAATFQTDSVTTGDGIVLDVGGETATVVTVDSEIQITSTVLSGAGTYDATEAYTITKASIVTLTDILTSVLTESVANGGPGFTSGQIDVSTCIDILLTRIRLEETENCLNFIKNLLDELGLAKGEDDDIIGIYYNHTNGKLTIGPIQQKTTPDLYYDNMILVDEDISLEGVFSAYLVEYTSGQNYNLIATERLWHPSRENETVGNNAVKVQHTVYQDEEHPLMSGWEKDTTNGKHNLRTERLTDGMETTGWGLAFGANPGLKADCLFGWFNDALDLFTVDEVEMLLDCRRESLVASPFWFQVLGITGAFDETDPQALPEANKIGLSGGLDLRFAEGGTDGFNKVEVSAQDIGIAAKGIILRWNGMAANLGGTRHCLVKEITVRGHLTHTVLVQLTNDDTKGAAFLYAPLSYTKLIDANLGQPRVDTIKIGQATFDSAISLGRLAVLQGLMYKASKLYELQSFHPGSCVPAVGQTAQMGDGTKTTVLGYNFHVEAAETLSIRTLDFTGVLI